MTGTTAAPAKPATAPASVNFRPDLEGLRAVAVLLVVAYHANLAWLPGGYIGVDVFYVLSGYFITGLLLREAERNATISIIEFYARRARRLLPVATLVTLATTAATWLWAAPVRQPKVGVDAIGASLNLANVLFAASAHNYQNAGADPSPFLHFWSLAVEEQFYWLWPWIFTLAAGAATVTFTVRRRRLAWTVGVLSALSLAAAIWQTGTNQTFAFFMLPTRAWELGAGALLAAAPGLLSRLHPLARNVFTLAGLSLVAVSAAVFSDTTPFPGWAATVPVAGAALVVAGAGSTGRAGTLLASRPARAVGRWSYSIYLWHWPILVLPAMISGAPLSWPVKVALGVVSVGAGAASYRWVENPIRRHPKLASDGRSMLLAAVLIGAGTAAGVVLAVAPRPVTLGPAVPPPAPAADRGVLDAALATATLPGNLTPALQDAASYIPAGTREGCHLNYNGTSFGDCVFGDPAGSRTVMLLGDSHAAQWMPALTAVADEHGWRIVLMAKGGCTATTATLPHPADVGRSYTECVTAQNEMLARVAAEKPDLVLLSSMFPYRDAAWTGPVRDAWFAGVADMTSRVLQAGARHVVWLGDTPHPAANVPECLSANPDTVAACNLVRADAANPGNSTRLAAAAVAGGARYVPTTDWLCTASGCPAVVGNLLVYRDESHLTAEAAVWLAPLLDQALKPELGGAPHA